jgi:hypothetical protein
MLRQQTSSILSGEILVKRSIQFQTRMSWIFLTALLVNWGSNPFPGAILTSENWIAKNHASRKNFLMLQKWIRQHTTTLTPTHPNIASMMTMWHNPFSHTQTAIQKQSKPK